MRSLPLKLRIRPQIPKKKNSKGGDNLPFLALREEAIILDRGLESYSDAE